MLQKVKKSKTNKATVLNMFLVLEFNHVTQTHYSLRNDTYFISTPNAVYVLGTTPGNLKITLIHNFQWSKYYNSYFTDREIEATAT